MNEFSENINEIATALSKFQGQVGTIEKDKEVNIRAKSGYNIKYKYADLATIMTQIRKPLSENGLCVSHGIQTQENQKRLLVTTVFHNSGQWLRSSMLIEQTNDEKSLGAKITYYRRYALSSLLGIVTDDDVDADLQGAIQQEPVQAVQPVKTKPKEVELSLEASEYYHSQKDTPHFKKFICHLLKKSGKSENELLNGIAKRQEDFEKSLKVFAYEQASG